MGWEELHTLCQNRNTLTIIPHIAANTLIIVSPYCPAVSTVAQATRDVQYMNIKQDASQYMASFNGCGLRRKQLRFEVG